MDGAKRVHSANVLQWRVLATWRGAEPPPPVPSRMATDVPLLTLERPAPDPGVGRQSPAVPYSNSCGSATVVHIDTNSDAMNPEAR